MLNSPVEQVMPSKRDPLDGKAPPYSGFLIVK